MDHPSIPPAQIQPLTPVGPRRPAGDSIYQIAIILAALLLVISASLF
jgi:hypothetical protein